MDETIKRAWRANLGGVVRLCGSTTAAAKYLNVNRTTLYDWRRGKTSPGGAQVRLLELASERLQAEADRAKV